MAIVGQSMGLRQPRFWAMCALVAASYFVAARLGLALAFAAQHVSVVWPPSGIALAATILLGYRCWPGIALGAFAANALANEPLLTALGISAGNTLEAVAGAWLLRRFVGTRPSMERLRDVMGLIVIGAILSPMVAATLGVLSLCLGEVHSWSSFGRLWRLWWLGDGMGVLLLTPLILTAMARARAPWPAGRALEFAAQTAVLVMTCLLVFDFSGAASYAYPVEFLIFPLIIWAALRLGPASTALFIGLTSIIGIVAALNQTGPFSLPTVDYGLVLLQLFMAVVAATGLMLAASHAERRRVEKALREREEDMRVVLKATRVGTWKWSVNDGEVQWSDNMEEIHGQPPGSFGGKFEDFIKQAHPEDRPRIEQTIARALEERGFYKIEYRQLRSGGQIGWLEGRGRVFCDAFGRPVRMAGICSDITERKALELRLTQLTGDLECQVEEQSRIAEQRRSQLMAMAVQMTQVENRERQRLATTLHDGLQQMLVGAKLRVSRLITRASGHEDILESAREVEDILTQCTRASRSLSHELSPPILIDRGLCAALHWLARQMRDEHALEVEIETGDEPARLSTDIKSFLFQSAREVLFNVVKHAQTGRAKVRMSVSQDALVLEVADEGKGFDPATIDRDGPAGLGLVNIRERVGLMGGDFDMISAPGRGSRFSIRIPLDELLMEGTAEQPIGDPATAANKSRRPPESRHPAGDGLRSVLIVDDHRMMREGLAMLLREEPDLQIVGEAANGIEAVEMARRLRPDIVVMDVSMPGMGGIEATRRIHAELPDIRIVGLSMHEEEGIAVRMYEAGAAVYLNKVGPPEALLSAIRGAAS